ncbi:Transposable element Tcb1 transposase [Lucilia cuprina]|nr:Transposable element Tcb1 transposase [Lucilia cuprina]
MDSKYYIDILKENVLERAENLGIKDDFVFYQDNDPKHKSWTARNWLLYNCPKVMETPAQSPDLNVIEHLWAELKKRVAKRKPKSIATLKEVVTEEWYNIEPEFCKKLVESIPRRLEAVIRNRGKSTKY